MRRARMPNRSLRIWGNLLLSAVLLSVYATSADVAHTGTDQSAQATQVSSSVYRGFAALCAVAKNENRYVREWVDHHKCLGFSRIYLYDHGSQERMSSQLEDHIASGFVSYNYFTGHHKKYSRDARPTSLEKFLQTAQGYAYKKCVKHHSKSHSFLGFIDIDEFLVLMDPGIASVEQLLRPYSGFGGLAVHWQLVGSSNHTARPAGPVTTSYTHCVKPEAMENRQFKVFANTAARPVMQNPHRPRLFAPQNVPFPYLVNEHRKRIRSGSENQPTHMKAAVMHYVIKSREDYEEKLARGGGAGVKRKEGYFEFIEHKARHPCPTSPAELQQRLCPASRNGGTNGTSTSAGR